MFRRANIKLVIYEIEGIPAISHVNPHVPVPCIIPRPCAVRAPAFGLHRLDNFPNTLPIYMRTRAPTGFTCVTSHVRPREHRMRQFFFPPRPTPFPSAPPSLIILNFPLPWRPARIFIFGTRESPFSHSRLQRVLPLFSESFYSPGKLLFLAPIAACARVGYLRRDVPSVHRSRTQVPTQQRLSYFIGAAARKVSVA